MSGERKTVQKMEVNGTTSIQSSQQLLSFLAARAKRENTKCSCALIILQLSKECWVFQHEILKEFNEITYISGAMFVLSCLFQHFLSTVSQSNKTLTPIYPLVSSHCTPWGNKRRKGRRGRFRVTASLRLPAPCRCQIFHMKLLPGKGIGQLPHQPQANASCEIQTRKSFA